MHMSPLAAQVVEDLMREYRHAWYDMMPQMLVNAFLALVGAYVRFAAKFSSFGSMLALSI